MEKGITAVYKKKYPLMPRATAVWLIDNTNLTFQQIAGFCGMHELEVKHIADEEVNIKGVNPILSGQITEKELRRCSNNPNTSLILTTQQDYYKRKKTKYTPIARRQDKPDAILWLIKNVPNIKDSVIIKLIGTTKATISAIRNRSHWNMANIKQRDPVLLGICTQLELDYIQETHNIKK